MRKSLMSSFNQIYVLDLHAEATWKNVSWERLKPAAPDFLFVVKDNTLARTYQAYWSVPQIFAPYGDPAPGFATQHDEFAISFSKEEAVEKVARFLATEDEADARRMFRLCAQTSGYMQRLRKNLTT
jgi:hypothetical protein